MKQKWRVCTRIIRIKIVSNYINEIVKNHEMVEKLVKEYEYCIVYKKNNFYFLIDNKEFFMIKYIVFLKLINYSDFNFTLYFYLR